MKSILALHCPSCGAELSVDEGKEITYCIYCGTKILLKDENETTTRHINEADVIRAESEREIASKQLELENKKLEEEAAHKKKVLKIKIIWAISSIALTIIGPLLADVSGDPDSGFYALAFLGFFSLIGCGLAFLLPFVMSIDNNQSGSQESLPSTSITITSALENWDGKPHTTVLALFKSCGFKNVQTTPLCDLRWESRKNGIVSSVLINGSETWEEGDEFSADAIVLILYHSVK